MTYETKDNEGALFKADKKTDKHPDYTGSAVVDGIHYWVSGWITESKKGVKYMPLKFKPKEQAFAAVKQAVSSQNYNAPVQNDPDDEIPF